MRFIISFFLSAATPTNVVAFSARLPRATQREVIPLPLPTASCSSSSPVQCTILYLSSSSSSSFDVNDDDSFDVEALRQKLEALVDSTGHETSLPFVPSTSSSLFSSSLPKPVTPDTPMRTRAPTMPLPPAPPLTTLDRERRRKEHRLLAQLKDSDEPVSDLWDLWFRERGTAAFQKLTHTEALVHQGAYDAAERALQDIIAEYGVWWAEPVNRLATLYYLQGRYEESERMCLMVLQVKPWHFGALSGIVMVYAAQHQVEPARMWAARRLPSLASTGPNRRRTAWVERAMHDAEHLLQQAEQRIQHAFGSPDAHVSRRPKPLFLLEFDDSAWQ
jgi:hypothetical protein